MGETADGERELLMAIIAYGHTPEISTTKEKALPETVQTQKKWTL